MVGFANQATPADINRTEEGVTRPNTSPMDSWDFQPDKAKVFETLHNISSPDFLPGFSKDMFNFVDLPIRPVLLLLHFQQILTGQANALLNSGLLERGPSTRNLSGACSSFSTWCRSVSCVESGLGEPGSENAFACAGSTRAVRTR